MKTITLSEKEIELILESIEVKRDEQGAFISLSDDIALSLIVDKLKIK